MLVSSNPINPLYNPTQCIYLKYQFNIFWIIVSWYISFFLQEVQIKFISFNLKEYVLLKKLMEKHIYIYLMILCLIVFEKCI